MQKGVLLLPISNRLCGVFPNPQMQIVGILIRVLEMPRFSHRIHPPVPYVSQLQIPTLSPGRIGFDAHSTTPHRLCLSSTRVRGIENLRIEFGHGPTVESLYNKPLKITMLAVLKLQPFRKNNMYM